MTVKPGLGWPLTDSVRFLKRAALACGVVVAAYVVAFALLASDAPSHLANRPPILGADSGLVAVRHDPAEGMLSIKVGPLNLPAHAHEMRLPIQLARMPAAGWLQGFSWLIQDHRGRPLPADLLHHVNLIDPDRRELFSPVALLVIAAGRETGPQLLPRIVGYPVQDGTRFLVVTMFSNPTEQAFDSVYLTVNLRYKSARRWRAPLAVYPLYLDVMGPVGAKSFEVPPGRTERSWAGSPATEVRVLAIGGHVHHSATRLALEDVTRGNVLWEAHYADGGARTARTDFWRRAGVRLRTDHKYRLTVVYENRSSASLTHGGMGGIGGVVIVNGSWPPVDRADPAYQANLLNIMSAPRAAAHEHSP